MNNKTNNLAPSSPSIFRGTGDYPILVLSLETATERRVDISNRLAELGLTFQFIPGVDGKQIDILTHPNYSPAKRRYFHGKDLSSGEYGCTLAHKAAYEYIVREQIPNAIILEDDALIAEEFPNIIKGLNNLSDAWDLVRFIGREKNYSQSRKIKQLGGLSYYLSRPRGIPGGAYGYMLNLNAAKKLLFLMESIWVPVDTLHGMTWVTKLRTYSIVPSPVLPNDEVTSHIDSLDDHARWEKKIRLTGCQKLVYPISRAMWKLYINLFTRYNWVSTWMNDKNLRKKGE